MEYPQLLYPWGFKLFYLTQCAFYCQCLILLFTEVGACRDRYE